MAQFLKAKFLSQALEWKFKYPSAKFYAGLRYEPFLFEQARKVFSDYSKLYPDNKEFTTKIVRDLKGKEEQLLKVINPEAITAEYEMANSQFETQAQIEQQEVAQATGQSSSQPFSFSSSSSAEPGRRRTVIVKKEAPPSSTAAAYSTPSSTEAPISTTSSTSAPASTTSSASPSTTSASQTSATSTTSSNYSASSTTSSAYSASTATPSSTFSSSSTNWYSQSSAPASQPIKAEPTTAFSRKFNFRGFKIPNSLKDFSSKAQIFAKKNLGKVFDGLKGIGGGVGRGITGGIGGGLGAAAPSLGRIGHGFANTLQRIPQPKGVGGGTKGLGKSSNRFALAGVGALLLFALLGGLLGGITGSTSTGESAPIGTTGTDISSCKFTRGGDSVKELTYKSPLLLSYIQEASSLTNIPPVVLAAFIRVESPSAVRFSDDQIKNYQCIESGPGKNVSSTGALGIMQLQPVGTEGHDEGPIANGAKLIGKTYGELTREDYCDVRKNIIMGAGFILKKLSYKTPEYPTAYGDGTRWDPSWTNNKEIIQKLVNGYYGCLVYGGADPNKCAGPFNYADDVSTSIQNCSSVSSQPGSGSTGISRITSAAAQITPLLYQTNPTSSDLEDRLFHNKQDEPGVYYWCTYIVVDAYKKAGFNGLDRTAHGAVLNMKSFFANTSGYQFLPASTPVEQLKPGDVIFFEGRDDQHTSLVKSVDVSQEGKGVIRTYESNNVVLEDVVFVQNHKATTAQTTADKFVITGFGKVTGN